MAATAMNSKAKIAQNPQIYVVIHRETHVPMRMSALDAVDACRRIGWRYEDCIVIGPFERLNQNDYSSRRTSEVSLPGR